MPKEIQAPDEELIIKFGRELKKLFEKKNLTQKEFAKRIGVQENTVTAWVMGRRQPTYTNLCAILRFFNIDYGESLFQWLIDLSSKSTSLRKQLNECYEKVGNQSIQISKLKEKVHELENELEKYKKFYDMVMGGKPN